MTATGAPLPPVVCLAGIDWDSLWQRSQILMSGFAERGAKVAFVEQLDAGRPITIRDWPRITARARNLLRRSSATPRQGNLRGKVQVVSPTILPFGLAAPLNAVLIRRLAARLGREGYRHPIVWIQPFGGPNTPALERALEPSLVVYDCVTRLSGYAHATPAMIAREEALVKRADLVLTDAKILWEEKRLLNPNCVQLPPGVDFEAFSPQEGRPEPDQLRALPRPRLGFFGAINSRLDQESLVAFAESHSSWAVVLIGPVQTEVSRLRRLPNVHFFPPLPHAELGAWLQAMDVLTIPYVRSEFTRGIIPAKLFESLATGKPVVATGLPELEPYREFVALTSSEGLGITLENSLKTDTVEARERRVGLARENSWASRVEAAWREVNASLLRK